MNYETASDLEINKLLTELILKARYPNADSIEFDRQGCFWVENTGFSSWPVENYCNDVSAIWPLIVEHNLSMLAPDVEWSDGKDWVCTDIHGSAPPDGMHQNPLRAAAICIIQVLEGEG